ncbi:MAG: hypothetical protein HS132_08085 [Planctomycetia bacterium]|nr:hypothetical protein [Planctomycetia bacterium]
MNQGRNQEQEYVKAGVSAIVTAIKIYVHKKCQNDKDKNVLIDKTKNCKISFGSKFYKAISNYIAMLYGSFAIRYILIISSTT